MKVVFLGTGTSQGVPVIGCNCSTCCSKDEKDKRLRCSVYIEEGDTRVVIDTGPDFRQQMLREGIGQLDGVVYTHAHRDHIAGLDDVRSFNFLQQRPMDIYAEQRVIDELSSMYSYAFGEDTYPGVPQLKVHRLEMDPFSVGSIRFIPIRVMHAALPVLGFRIDDFAYLVDLNNISSEEKKKLKGTRYLVVDALRKEPHHSHFNVRQAVDLIEEVGAEHAWLTHISHLMGRHTDLDRELPPHIHPAFDQLELVL
jgi:phosphoribosyl 1,2-cyclic phosphate phosphodiesterase